MQKRFVNIKKALIIKSGLFLGAYVLLGVLWIFFSDLALFSLPIPMEIKSNISVIKGFFYVIASGLVFTVFNYITDRKLMHKHNEVVDLNRQMSFFVEKLVHNFRGPVASGMGMCRLMIMENEKPKVGPTNPEMMFESLKIADKALHEFYSLAQMFNRDADYRVIKFNEIYDNIREYLHKLDFENTNVDFRWEIGKEVSVTADPVLVENILKQLIENGIRYHKQRNNVQSYVEVRLFRNNRNFWAVSVSDNGEGIPAEIGDSIFNLFFRGGAKQRGAGMGLYLARLSVQKMHGRIWHEANHPYGSNFYFEIPKPVTTKTNSLLVKTKNIYLRLLGYK